MSEAVTPYPEKGGGSTSGHTGSDTSHERAVREDSTGITSMRQRKTLQLLATSTYFRPEGNAPMGHWSGDNYGLTVKELRELTGWHHGQASSTLSVLHKVGQISRLKDRRDNCAIYVLPEWVKGRETAAPGRTAATVEEPTLSGAEKLILAHVNYAVDTGVAYIPARHAKALTAIIERIIP